MLFFSQKTRFSICVQGKESEEWLNRICSQKIAASTRGSLTPASFLNYKGQMLARFLVFHAKESLLFLWGDEAYKEKILNYLEEAHFGEDLEWKLQEEEISYDEWIPENEKESQALKSLQIEGALIGEYYPQGQSLFFSNKDRERIANEVGECSEVSTEEYEVYRAKCLYPRPGSDFDEGHILLESSALEVYAHDNKGCYPGQEVINKIRSIGQVSRKYSCFSYTSSEYEVCLGEKLQCEELGEVQVQDLFHDKHGKYFVCYLRPVRMAKLSSTSVIFRSEKNVDIPCVLLNLV